VESGGGVLERSALSELHTARGEPESISELAESINVTDRANQEKLVRPRNKLAPGSTAIGVYEREVMTLRKHVVGFVQRSIELSGCGQEPDWFEPVVNAIRCGRLVMNQAPATPRELPPARGSIMAADCNQTGYQNGYQQADLTYLASRTPCKSPGRCSGKQLMIPKVAGSICQPEPGGRTFCSLARSRRRSGLPRHEPSRPIRMGAAAAARGRRVLSRPRSLRRRRLHRRLRIRLVELSDAGRTSAIAKKERPRAGVAAPVVSRVRSGAEWARVGGLAACASAPGPTLWSKAAEARCATDPARDLR